MSRLRFAGRIATAAVAALIGPFAGSAPAATGATEQNAVASCGAPTASVALGADTARLDGTIRLTGTGWCHPAGGGSTIGVKIDEGAISRLNDSVHTNRTIWQLVQAEPDGTFSVDVHLPDGTAATSTPALATGRHSFRLLSGSLLDGDAGRSVLSPGFDVVGSGIGPTDAPDWPHQVLTGGSATAYVERVVATGDGATLRVKGFGWTNPRGGGSTVAVKLGSSSGGGQHRRSGTAIVQHPSASGDDTIWALIAPGGGAQPQVYPMGADGTFEITLDLPPGLADGDYLTAALTSGRFATGDTQRTMTSRTLQVGGTAWDDSAAGSDVVCKPTSAAATVTIDTPEVAPGGVLTISGTGWCNPAGGGSKLGVKIDEGAISHLDGSVHSNRTIWALVQAEHADGTFTADLQLPDGTTATSIPALGNGSHTLRLLSGSLLPGDTVRTVKSDTFVIGDYRPNGLPDPLDPKRLTRSDRSGLVSRVDKRTLTVRLPRAAEGDWVFLGGYAADGSPRYPWSDTWFRLDATRTITTRIPKDAPAGRIRLVAQSGNRSDFGALVGWAPVTLRAEAPGPDDESGDTEQSTPTGVLTPGLSTPAQAADLLPPPADAPVLEPAAPAKNYVEVGLLDEHDATGSLEGSLLRVTLPHTEAGAQVHVRGYGTEQFPVGWAVLDPERRVILDLARLPAGSYRFTFTTGTGEVLGWVGTTWGPDGTPQPGSSSPRPVAETPQTPMAASAGQVGWSDAALVALGLLILAGSGLSRRIRGAHR